MTDGFPAYAVAGQRVYALSFTQQNTLRAFNRDLVDFCVELKDVVSAQSDRTLVGMSSELAEDYPAFKEPIPLAWLLVRFLVHHIATGNHAALRQANGPVLMTTTYSAYLGESLQDELADEAVVRILQTWVRDGLGQPISLSSLFASTNLSLDTLRRSINALVARGLVTPEAEDSYGIDGAVWH